MRHSIPWVIVFVAVVVLAVQYASSNPTGHTRDVGFSSVLRPGQVVVIRDIGGRFEITAFAKQPATVGYKIVDVGQDYVAVVDVPETTETRIPIWSIKSLILVRDATGKSVRLDSSGAVER